MFLAAYWVMHECFLQCHVQIMATTKAAALEARRNLEFTEGHCSVPKAIVGMLIGHNGRAIQVGDIRCSAI